MEQNQGSCTIIRLYHLTHTGWNSHSLLSEMLDGTMNSTVKVGVSTQVPRISSLPRCVWQEPNLPGITKQPKFRGIRGKNNQIP